MKTPESEMLYRLYQEFVATNKLLVKALDHLDKIHHPFADTAKDETLGFWLNRHVAASAIQLDAYKLLKAKGYPVKEEGV